MLGRRPLRIPSTSVTLTGNCAFSYCSGLRHLTLPSNIAEVNVRTFKGATTLECVLLVRRRLDPAVAKAAPALAPGAQVVNPTFAGRFAIAIPEASPMNCAGGGFVQRPGSGRPSVCGII
jgi:hypothetical protein